LVTLLATRRDRVLLACLTALVLTLALGLAVVPSRAQAAVDRSGLARLVYTPGQRASYAYGPSVVSSGARTYYFSCHSRSAGEIRDSIWAGHSDGGATQGDHLVVAPSASGWDSHHICDPSVVAGTFRYAGTTYRYAMFYLGTDRENTDNRIGVALATSLDGEWVKYPEPIVGIPAGAEDTWGVGQPSAITTDPANGEVLLFYTDGTAGTVAYRRDLVLGDLDHPTIHPPQPVTSAGLGGDVLHNFDVAYDPRRDRFYMAREAGPRPTSQPVNISDRVEVDSISAGGLRTGAGAWRVENRITPKTTGFARNHNPGLLRTVHGTLPAGDSIEVVLSRSTVGAFPGTLYSYDLWSVTGSLSAANGGRNSDRHHWLQQDRIGRGFPRPS
jgi:hypothetical protein